MKRKDMHVFNINEGKENDNKIKTLLPIDPEEADLIEDEEDENEGIEVTEESIIEKKETKVDKNDKRFNRPYLLF